MVVNDIDAKSGERVAKEIHGTFIQADVTKGADWARLVRAAGPALDIVVNNAGWTHRKKPYLEVSEAEFDKVYAVNVKSVYLSALHAVPVFRSRGGGCFVNIASTAGIRPRPGLTVYNSSKAAVILMSKSMAGEFGPDKIRVNCVNPVFSPETEPVGGVRRRCGDRRGEEEISRHDPARQVLHTARHRQRLPLPRLGRGEPRERRVHRGRRRALRLGFSQSTEQRGDLRLLALALLRRLGRFGCLRRRSARFVGFREDRVRAGLLGLPPVSLPLFGLVFPAPAPARRP